METGTAGRLIFALSFNKSRLESTFFGQPIKHALVSYYYLRRSTVHSTQVALKVLKRIRKQVKTLFIDSGVFTLKVKYMGVSVAGKLGSEPQDKLAESNAKIREEHLPVFARFALGYSQWLRKNEDLYDWAFDLDVDQFLGIKTADVFYRTLCASVKNPDKIIRVWHASRKFDDWVEWCESGRYKYLAIEGGMSHGRNIDFYRRFVEKAHKHRVKVHVLAATDPSLMQNVPFDSCDSSSWMIGSRFGQVMTPFAMVSFGHTKSPASGWNLLSGRQKKNILEFWKERGVDPDLDKMQTSWVNRELANIQYYLWLDRPFDGSAADRTSFLSRVGL